MTKAGIPARGLAAVVEQANRAATFHAYVPADANNGATGLPCVEIAGLQVYAYLDINPITGRPRLRTSVHFDTADPEVFGAPEIIDHDHSIG